METAGLSRVLLTLTLLSIATTGLGEPVYLSLGSTNITTNNTEILITDIGQDALDGLPSLTCHTYLTVCCRSVDNGGQGSLGEWYYPDGRVVQNSANSTAAGEKLYRVKSAPQVIRLARKASNPLEPTGSYCCVILITGGEMTFCANIVVCPSLPPLTNGMLSYSDPTLGVDSVATNNCDTGYTLNRGSITRTCQSDGTWSGSAPTCISDSGITPPVITIPPVTTCSDLTDPSNGRVAHNAGSTDNRPVGTKATYSCDTGYTLNGRSTRTCQSSGAWSGSVPTCEAVDCGTLTNPSNGMVSLTSTIFGSTADYSCDSGYTLNEIGSRLCGADGMWTHVEPTCKPVSCGSPPSIPNGSLGTPTSTIVGGTVTYSCESRYILSGSATVICGPSGNWSTPPSCLLITCSDLPPMANGVIFHHGGVTDNRPAGTIATYSCDTSYTLNGGSTRTCQSDGAWSGSPPTCQAPPVYLSLFSTNYLSGLSEIPLSSVGEGRSSSLVCHTDLDEGLRDGLGNWYFPNGSVISEEGELYIIRDDQMVSLNRRTSAQAPGGLYCCVVPTSIGEYDTACIVLAVQPEPSSSPQSDTTGAIVGGVVATVIIVVGVVIIVYLVLRYKRIKQETVMSAHNVLALAAKATALEANTLDDKTAPCYEELSFSHQKTDNCTLTRNESYHIPKGIPRGGACGQSNLQDDRDHYYSSVDFLRTN